MWDDALGTAVKIHFRWVPDEELESIFGPQGTLSLGLGPASLTIRDIIDAWPVTSRGPSAGAHLDELADALDTTADELADLLAEYGVAVLPELAIKRGSQFKRAPGVRYSEVAAETGPAT